MSVRKRSRKIGETPAKHRGNAREKLRFLTRLFDLFEKIELLRFRPFSTQNDRTKILRRMRCNVKKTKTTKNRFLRFEIFDFTQYSVLSTQYSVLSTQYSVLSTQYSVLSTQYSVLRTQDSETIRL